jgi:hypothetical protein
MERKMYSLVCWTMHDSVSKLVAPVVYKFSKIIAPNFTYPNNNYYRQHGISRQRVKPYKEKDLTSVNSFIVKNS